MTTHTVCYESLGSRNANASGLRPDGVWQQVANLDWATDNVLTDPIPWELIPKSATGAQVGVPVTAIHIIPEASADSMGLLVPGRDFGQLDGATLDNGATQCVSTNASSGRQSPRIQLSFGGDFETALIALGAAFDGMQARVLHNYGTATYQGLAHFIEFEDQPPNSDSDGSLALRLLLAKVQNAGASYQVGVQSDGTVLTAQGCGFAANAPEGAVYIDPVDVGTGPDQLSSDVTQNTAGKFRAHPNVFYPAGRSDYVRSLTRQNVDGVSLIAGSAGQPMRIVSITSAITSSNWLVIVDGVASIVRLEHTDIRRPRDIWNQVWQPIIQGSSLSVADALTWLSPNANDGGGVGTRWKYMDYARCLEIAGSDITQTGGGG